MQRSELVEAARAGDLRRVKALLQQGTGVDKDNALPWAAREGRLEVVRHLVEHGAVVNSKDYLGETALMRAAEGGHTQVIWFLTEERKCDINASSMNGFTALMYSARGGQVEVARYLTGLPGIQLDAKDTFGYTALMKACKAGHVDVVRCLAEAGASVNETDALGHTTVMIASGSGHLEVMRYLVEECGVGVNARSKRGDTAVRLAVASGYHDIERYLTPLLLTPRINDAGGGDAVEIESSFFPTNACAESLELESVPQVVAAMQRLLVRRKNSESEGVTRVLSMFTSLWNRLEPILGQIDGRVSDECEAEFCALVAEAKAATLKLRTSSDLETESMRWCSAFERRVDAFMDSTGEKGATDLMWAARNGQVEVARALIDGGTDVNAQTEDGRTALMIAAENDQLQMVKYLVEHGASLTSRDSVGNTVLMAAAEKGRVEVCHHLAELPGCDADATNDFGHTALIRAAANGHLNVVRYLSDELDADVNTESKAGLTVLMMATMSGASDIVRFLADSHGADVNAKTNDGDTVLMLAASGGRMDAVTYFTEEWGLDVNAKNGNGDTALMRAAANGKVAIVGYLTEHGVDVNATNKRGHTALMKAARNGHVEVVQCLLKQRGIDVDHRNQPGESAIRLAADRGHQEIRRMLMPFLPPHPQHDTTELRCSNDLPSYMIPPSEVGLVHFFKNGNSGGEYFAKWLDADAVVKLFIPDASHTAFKDEVRLWQQLRHPNVMKMYGACDVGPNLQFFVCEYASNGSLIEHVQFASTKRPTMWKLLHEAALGLEYLHERGIVHGDLRCSNILIGSDGLAKLSNFGLSGSTKRSRRGALIVVGSKRWQAPEVLEGKPPTVASDVYSLGLCIVEAATREKPWGCPSEHTVDKYKIHWTPETDTQSFSEPDCPPGDARRLLWRMCSYDPDQRASLSSVVYELERLAIAGSSSPSEPECEPAIAVDDKESIDADELWLDVEQFMILCDEDRYCRAFDDLKRLRKALIDSSRNPTLAAQFKALLTDFYRIITMPPDQFSLLQASSTCGMIANMDAFHSRIDSVLTSLKTSLDDDNEGDLRWQHQRNEQTGRLTSEVKDTPLLLSRLKTPEERAAYLRTLKTEMENPQSKYTPDQVTVMTTAYTEISSTIESEDLSELIPEWFIPRFELIVDEWRGLGSGGFGSVYRARWLDSEVVAKLLGSETGDSSSQSSSSSLSDLSSSRSLMDSADREEAIATFRHEVEIWFGFNHPHIIRLFGACHVDTPFFVCEYATNGTLVSYLRKHPNELWTKLREAALGVQYLHARGVVHGDLKGNNIVIGSDMKAKVTDFGLSSIVSKEDMPQISGAWHWVAPECLPEPNDAAQNAADKRPTFESDIYSLGMCIVEALRVVEKVKAVKCGKKPQPCLPWGKLDNFLVRYHATKGKLPAPPASCNGDEWEIVKQMCAFDPEERVKISTVVDKLAQMASGQYENLKDKLETQQGTPKLAQEAITAARKRLSQLIGGGDRPKSLPALHASLWDRLDHVHGTIDGTHASECQTAFYSLVADADEATRMLQNMNNSLISLAETTMRYYALNRRLDKFCDAYSHQLKQNTEPSGSFLARWSRVFWNP